MAREILLSKKTEQGLRLDPRTKLLLIFIISIFVMGGTGGEAMGLIRLVLCVVPAILLLTSKQCAKAVGYIAVFSAFYAVQIYVLPHLTGILNFLVLFTTGFFCRILPSVAIAAYAVKTTTVSELISGMERIHMPKVCILYTSPSPRDRTRARMPSSARKKKQQRGLDEKIRLQIVFH